MVTWQNDVTTIFKARGLADDLGIYIKITGENDSPTLKFTDPFRCFKLALSGFIKHINGNNHFMNTKLLEDIVLILEKGVRVSLHILTGASGAVGKEILSGLLLAKKTNPSNRQNKKKQRSFSINTLNRIPIFYSQEHLI